MVDLPDFTILKVIQSNYGNRNKLIVIISKETLKLITNTRVLKLRMELQEYLAQLSGIRSERINQLRELILRLYPNAVESMRYKMPTYESETGWVAIANQKQYVSLYTCSEQHIASFKAKYPTIKSGKGCINFRDSITIPYDDLEQVIISAMNYQPQYI